MSSITTHVLDTSIGKPGVGISVSLEQQDAPSKWKGIGSGVTNDDGRVVSLLPKGLSLNPGVYRLTFETKKYFSSRSLQSFYPFVSIVFEIADAQQHFHVPLLISPFGYSTYRGS